MRLFLLSAVLGGLLASGCSGSWKDSGEPGEPLYFAMEVRQQGKLIAKPKLLGHSGVRVQAERRKPGATQPDYSLTLDPAPTGQAFKVAVDLKLPQTQGRSELALHHGQEQTVQLGTKPGELEISLMLMRVDSPEFRALIAFNDGTRSGSDAI